LLTISRTGSVKAFVDALENTPENLKTQLALVISALNPGRRGVGRTFSDAFYYMHKTVNSKNI
jgi:hypothetical protein